MYAFFGGVYDPTPNSVIAIDHRFNYFKLAKTLSLANHASVSHSFGV